MTIYFKTIEYLKSGNSIQYKAYKVLTDSEIMVVLKEYDPILAGTIPIGINVTGSDLDILCYARDLAEFSTFVNTHFGEKDEYTTWERGEGKYKAVVASFRLEVFGIELFGQNIPPTEQQAYRHMIIEYKLLEQYGEDFRKKIIALKQMGYKTEPAFAKLLGLEGDSYEALLKLYR